MVEHGQQQEHRDGQADPDAEKCFGCAQPVPGGPWGQTLPSIQALCELPHRPCDPDLASLWDHTAALLDHHHTAFGPEISRDHGQPHGADAYTASRDGTRHAIDHLDRVIHPRRERLRRLVQDTGRDPGHEHDAGIEM